MSTDDDFAAYVGTHWSTLVRGALLLGSDAERAEAVAADALVGSYQSWARVWQDDRAEVEVWTRLLDRIYAPSGRTWRGDVTLPGPAPPAPRSPGPSTEEAEEPDEPVLAGALSRLDPAYRDVLVLHYVSGLDELAAADVLDVPPAAVQQRIEQALSAVPLARSVQQLVALVEQHRRDQPMSLPPADLLALAHDVRRRRRTRTTAVTAAVLAAVLIVSGAVHVVRGLGSDAAPAAYPPPDFPAAPRPAVSSTRLVGANGWAVRVPSSWGTDQVACDGLTAARPTVLFARLLTRGADCRTGPPTRYVRIGDDSFPGVPWRTISGVPVLRRRHVCGVCARLRVPSASVSFEIRAHDAALRHRIEASLQPIGIRQVVVPIGPPPTRDRPALDEMVSAAIGSGLRPRVLEIPSLLTPGTFLRSDPPIGTPIDLGRSISLFFSAGDLGRFATTASLRRHGWRIFAETTSRPTYGRLTAVRAAVGRTDVRGNHPTFLRTLTIVHDGPRRVVVRRRLVWLVVSPTRVGPQPGASSIAAIDATTGRVIEAQQIFRGRVRKASG
jgi:RNA polymerase sigma-70 factor, ECF subfamily